MADPLDTSGTDSEALARPMPWGTIAAIGAFLVLGMLTFWIMHEKKGDQAQKTAQAALDKELFADEESMKQQREKLSDLTRKVEELRTAIQVGQVSDGKAAVEQFKKLANEQRAAREEFTRMADAYNQKVAEFRKLEK